MTPPRRWLSCSPLLWYVPIAAVAVVTLYAFSAPVAHYLPLVVVTLAWPAIGVATLGWYIAHAAVRRTLRPRPVHWAPALASAVVVIMLLFDLPLMARYGLSRPAMDQLVADADRDVRSIRPRDRVGLWPIESPYPFEGGVRFVVRDIGDRDRGGFAYSASGPPPKARGIDEYEHLHGDWYVWRRRS